MLAMSCLSLPFSSRGLRRAPRACRLIRFVSRPCSRADRRSAGACTPFCSKRSVLRVQPHGPGEACASSLR